MPVQAAREVVVKGMLGAIISASLLFGLLSSMAATAQAAPVHPPLPDLGLNSSSSAVEATPDGMLDHACGVATDTDGNLYVSSAGRGDIDVFGPTGSPAQPWEFLASIADGGEPCGLSVSQEGVLLVLDSDGGEVVRYVPDSFPFAGSPSYGPREVVDAGGEASAISIDPADGNLYVAQGDRVDVYANETQLVSVPFAATTGEFTLTFEGEETSALPVSASHQAVQDALEALASIGPGGVIVLGGSGSAPKREHRIVFLGAGGLEDQPPIEVKESGLDNPPITHSEVDGGLIDSIGAGDLDNAVGVAAYTYKGSNTRYLFVADDSAADTVEVFSGPSLAALKHEETIEGPSTGDPFEFGSGAYLAADPGSCPPAGQACSAGHFYLYDDGDEALHELEATGVLLDSTDLAAADPAFADAAPTAIAIDRSGGENDGSLFVTSGAGPNAKVLAFGPLSQPSRAVLESPLSHALTNARAVATDSKGNVYVAADTKVFVFDPAGTQLTEIEDKERPFDLDVDSEGRVFVLDIGEGIGGEKATYYTPSVYPPIGGTTYARHEPPIVTPANFPAGAKTLRGIGLNPANNHLFVTSGGRTIEVGSVGEGSPILDSDFAPGLLQRLDVAVYGKNGNVLISANPRSVHVLTTLEEKVTTLTGSGGPAGSLSPNPGIAIDQSNGHVLTFDNGQSVGGFGVAEEYEASGAFVAAFGKFTDEVTRPYRIAVDNSDGPSQGRVYVAFDDPNPGVNPFDVTAFSPLAYGAAPIAETGEASDLTGTSATLNGTVDPEAFELEECAFQYLTEDQYIEDGETFANATSVDCVPDLATIGSGSTPVPVSAEASGLNPTSRYVFRLVAENEFGPSFGDANLFGAPIATTKATAPIFYTEATLRASVDPSGLTTKYHFEYGQGGEFEAATPEAELSPSVGPIEVQFPVGDLLEGQAYEVRVVAENAAGEDLGDVLTFKTLVRGSAPPCPNAEYRVGRSTHLPDCRAYELVTPADTRGNTPYSGDTGAGGINSWLTPPRGAGAGEALSYVIDGTLPGFDGTGRRDGYLATRGAGDHPAGGWASELIGPTYAQAGGGQPTVPGFAADQQSSIWRLGPLEMLAGTLSAGIYLRGPVGFEQVGVGSLGADPNPSVGHLSPGGAHLVFESEVQLEAAAPPTGTTAVYDRIPTEEGHATEVVSIKPGGGPFGAGEDASFLGATEDGADIVFGVGGALYLRSGGETLEVASDAPPSTYGGIAEDGSRVFYAKAGDLWLYDVQLEGAEEIAPDSTFVNVSGDGSHVYFASEEEIGGEGSAGDLNLYLWDGAGTRFIGLLDPQDTVGFDGSLFIDLLGWTEAITDGGRGNSPARSTPDGEVFVFQSHAQLSGFDNEGIGQVYRYDADAAPAEALTCISCSASGKLPAADATLQSVQPARMTTFIPNVTDDGDKVFFQSRDRLLPEDTNSSQDVYEWTAGGAPGCEVEGGCLSLISTGQSERDSFLYGMSADGADVFLSTQEKLLGADLPGSPSLYDARENGGIPDPPAADECEGDACQGQGSEPPALPSPTTTTAPAKVAPKKTCPKGKRKTTTKAGKVRCKQRPKKAHKKRRAGQRPKGGRG